MFRVVSPELSRVLPDDPRRAHTGRSTLVLVASFLMLGGLAVLAGCGGDKDAGTEKEGVVIATVGDHEITDVYYRERLAKLKPGELPRNEDGTFKDMATLDGKLAFLDVIISKELLYLKALDLGYDKREKPRMAYDYALAGAAGRLFDQDAVIEPAGNISDDALQTFYSRLGESRVCDVILSHSRDDAYAARQALLDGADWDTVWRKYNLPGYNQNQSQMTVQWGDYSIRFESVVFNAPEGGISDVFEGEQGYWLFRIAKIEHGDKPDFEAASDEMLGKIYRRQIAENRYNLINQVMQDHEFKLDEATLKVCYAGLPEGEQALDPDTGQPVPRDQLAELAVAPKDMDLPFYSYLEGGERQSFTLGDYKAYFDKANSFVRPKKTEGLRSLYTKIRGMVVQKVMDDENLKRGYRDDPRAIELARQQVEKIIVGDLYNEAVDFKKEISAEELQAYWDANQDKLGVPEGRSGMAVVCASLDKAREAHEALLAGKDWSEVLPAYCVDQFLIRQHGDTTVKYQNRPGRFVDQLFSLQVGEFSEPVATEGGFAVVQLTKIEPPHERTFEEARDLMEQQIREHRENEAFQRLLSEWRQEFPVVVYEDRMADLPTWQELQPDPDPSARPQQKQPWTRVRS